MSPEYTCEITVINQAKVTSVRARQLPAGTFMTMSDMFKVLADPTRLKIIYALSLEELCVCDIATLLVTTKSAVSHQLRLLRNVNAVSFRKDGKIAYYSLTDTHIKNLFAEALKHILI